MGDVSDDILDGHCCFKCQTYFEQGHSHPVLCDSCWDRVTPDEQAKGTKATHAELVPPDLGEPEEKEERPPDESEIPEINTHGLLMNFGRHNGERITRVPIGYLRWAVAQPVERLLSTPQGAFPFWVVAKAEIQRRGERRDDIEVSGHAIDRLSLRYRKVWHNTRQPNEGLYSWAQRQAKEAWSRRENARMQSENVYSIKYLGIIWIIEAMALPVVKTVK